MIRLHTSLRIAVAALVLMSAQTTTNAQDMSSKLPEDPNVVTGKLENGLTYYIRQNKKPANKVELRLAVKAGSILESEEQLGLAHFMEHMNFNGTKNFQKNELVSYLQSIGVQFGADLNAYTSFDQTVYILPIPTDKPGNLEKGFQIIEDWAHNALLTDKDIDEERGVVLEESRLGKGADDRMLKMYFPKLAEGSLYAERLPIGKDEILKNFKYDKVRSFYHDWYRPDLQAVMVVGDITTDAAKKMIEEHFGKIANPANERTRNYQQVSPRKAPDAMVVNDKEATNTFFTLQFPYTKKPATVTLADYKRDLTKVLAQLMFNKRLSDLTKTAKPPFAFAGCSPDNLVHGHEAFSVFAVVASEPIETVVSTVTGEIVKAEKYGFNEGELELARKTLLSSVEKSYNERNTTESGQMIEEYIRVFLDGECFPGIENEYKYQNSILPNIKVAEVNEYFNAYVANKNTFSLITAPEKPETKLPSSAQLLDMTNKGFKQSVSKQEEKTVATSLLTYKPTPGKIVSTAKEDGFNAVTFTLSNGVKVTIKQTDFKSDEILMKGVKKGGANNYGVADRSNVKFATDLMDNMGYGIYNPTQIEEILSGKQIGATMAIGDIYDEVNCSSTVKDFEAMMQLAWLQITQPRKDEALFKAYKEKQKSMVQFTKSNPQAAFMDTAVKTMYNNNPLARMVIPTNADFDRLKLDRAFEIYREEFSGAEGYHFFITGNVELDKVIPYIEMYLGSIPQRNKVAAFKDNGVRVKKGVNEFRFNKGKEKKSMIMAIYSGEVKYSEELSLRAKAVSEILNIKVIEDLREKMGAIYGGGFNAAMSKEPYERYSFQLYLPCGPENVDKLIAAANEEIERLKLKGPEEKDLDKVKSQWIEKYKTDAKENKFWQEKMESVLFWGRDKNNALSYEEMVNKLTTQQVQDAAKLLFTNNNRFTAVLNPEK